MTTPPQPNSSPTNSWGMPINSGNPPMASSSAAQPASMQANPRENRGQPSVLTRAAVTIPPVEQPYMLRSRSTDSATTTINDGNRNPASFVLPELSGQLESRPVKRPKQQTFTRTMATGKLQRFQFLADFFHKFIQHDKTGQITLAFGVIFIVASIAIPDPSVASILNFAVLIANIVVLPVMAWIHDMRSLKEIMLIVGILSAEIYTFSFIGTIIFGTTIPSYFTIFMVLAAGSWIYLLVTQTRRLFNESFRMDLSSLQFQSIDLLIFGLSSTYLVWLTEVLPLMKAGMTIPEALMTAIPDVVLAILFIYLIINSEGYGFQVFSVTLVMIGISVTASTTPLAIMEPEKYGSLLLTGFLLAMYSVLTVTVHRSLPNFFTSLSHNHKKHGMRLFAIAALFVVVPLVQVFYQEYVDYWLNTLFVFVMSLLLFARMHVILVMRDMQYARREDLAASLELQASHDELTGLVNHMFIRDQMRNLLSNGQDRGLSVIMINIDGFKHINDVIGHEYGDQALISIAQRLSSYATAGQTVARYDGDIFLVIEEGITDPHIVGKVANKIMESVHGAHRLSDGQIVRIGVSLGVAICQGGEDVSDALALAQAAVARSKEVGRGTVTILDAHQDEALLRREIGQRLNSIKIDSKDFINLLVRPISGPNNTLFGVEATPRWAKDIVASDANLSSITDDKLLSIIDQSELHREVGEWTVEKTISWAAEQRVPVMLNLSPKYLLDNSISQHILKCCKQYEYPIRNVTVLISESLTATYGSQIITVHQNLDKVGVSLAIDDFGGSAFGLSQLRSKPIHKVVIAESMVVGALESIRLEAVLKSVIHLARCFDFAVYTRGVDSPEANALINSLNVDGQIGNAWGGFGSLDDAAKLLSNYRNTTKQRRTRYTRRSV